MKKLTKLFALLLVLALTLGTVSIVMADEPPVGGENEITAGPVTITNAMARRAPLSQTISGMRFLMTTPSRIS